VHVSGRNSQNVSQTMSVVAVTAAEPGPPWIRATSPKWSPGPRLARVVRLLDAVACPESIMKKALPGPDRWLAALAL
jgi:hypothetical protein